jgi:hypothetical protein
VDAGPASLTGSWFDSSSSETGGAVYFTANAFVSSPNITNNTFASCESNLGGAMFFETLASDVLPLLSGNAFSNNLAALGPAIFFNDSSVLPDSGDLRNANHFFANSDGDRMRDYEHVCSIVAFLVRCFSNLCGRASDAVEFLVFFAEQYQLSW